MRRLLLFVALLTLVGLSTAFAASFDVSSEDIATFSTDVSISVPSSSTTSTTAPPVTTRTYFLGGSEADLPGPFGTLGTGGGVVKKSIDPGTGTVQSQDDAALYQSWQTDAEELRPLVLDGPASLRIILPNGDTIKAALFRCSAADVPTSEDCTQIGAPDRSGTPGTDPNEYKVDFGIIKTTLLAGERLRVQIMNPSDKKWNAQWGPKDNRPSALMVTVVVP